VLADRGVGRGQTAMSKACSRGEEQGMHAGGEAGAFAGEEATRGRALVGGGVASARREELGRRGASAGGSWGKRLGRKNCVARVEIKYGGTQVLKRSRGHREGTDFWALSDD
jgi:hypothetical protein